LAEPHVRGSLEQVLGQRRLKARFALLSPTDSTPPRYRLFLQWDGDYPTEQTAASIAAELQQALEGNPHYRYAIGLRQLVPLEVAILDPASPAMRYFEEECLRRGQRLGDIKPTTLDHWNGWEQK